MCVLKVSGLSKSYRKKPIIKDVSFQMEAGELCVLLGANGSGKTTITHLLTGLIHKDSGTVEIAGADLDKEYRKAIKHVGMCFDKFILQEELSGYDNLKLSADLCGGNDRDIMDLLQRFGLRDASKNKVKQYSSGMKQKLSLARAIMQKPKLLIMDEPANMLDHKSSIELYQTLKLLKAQGMSILVVTHLISDIEPYADSAIFIKEGRIQLMGKSEDIRKEKNKDLAGIYDALQ